ncbi:hypothetical protein V6Z77_009653 [Aspergillus fumigatus]
MLHRAIPQKIAGIMNLCASNHKHLEPDDPALVEEHKLLLSKFMEPSSRGTKEIERVSCNNFETVFHSQTSMSSASNTINDEFSAVTNPGVTSGGRKDCNVKVALGLPTSARKRSIFDQVSRAKDTTFYSLEKQANQLLSRDQPL